MRSARVAIAGLVLLLVGGCATGRVAPPPAPATAPPHAPATASPHAPATAPPRAPATVPPHASATAPLHPSRPPAPLTAADNNYLEGVVMLEEGKCRDALDRFAAAWKENPGYPGVEKNVSAALDGLKKKGDEALRQGHPREAAIQYSIALRFFSHPAAQNASVSFTKRTLKQKIDKISAALMEKGLADYRQGKLKEAIATWRQILAYDPSHKEAAKAVKTATTQLENLKKLTPPPPPK